MHSFRWEITGNGPEMSTAAKTENKSDPPVADPTAAGPEGDAESITQTVG